VPVTSSSTSERTPEKRTLKTYLSLVKFEHTLFALPFAYGGMLLAERRWPGLGTFLWITLAMVGARTASMALNRVIDAEMDARNPRTEGREIPRGALSKRDGVLLAVAGLAALVLAGWALNPLTLALLPVAVVFLVLYPYTKRFTWLCHYWLGVTNGAAAAGGWIAVTGNFAPAALALWAGVALWIGGFDIIYALLDLEFDRRHGVHSIPARFGPKAALNVAAATHAAAWVCLALSLPLSGSSWPYGLGLVVMAAILITEHRLVRSRGAGAALESFNANLYIGAAMLLAIVLEVALYPS
jgi:4-hydroxybenzoate polyprenyltransferase